MELQVSCTGNATDTAVISHCWCWGDVFGNAAPHQASHVILPATWRKSLTQQSGSGWYGFFGQFLVSYLVGNCWWCLGEILCSNNIIRWRALRISFTSCGFELEFKTSYKRSQDYCAGFSIHRITWTTYKQTEMHRHNGNPLWGITS